MKRKLIERCKELGCMLVDQGDVIFIDAPIGKVISSIGCHSKTMFLDGWKRADAYVELIETMKLGLEDCEDSDCDSCIHEKMTFEQILELYRGERLA